MNDDKLLLFFDKGSRQSNTSQTLVRFTQPPPTLRPVINYVGDSTRRVAY